MEPRHFDEIAKALGDGVSRRGAIRTAAAGAVAAVLARLGVRETAAARCKKRLKVCQSRRDCCGADKGRQACRLLTNGQCGQAYPGRRCCGLEGARCSNVSCECCGSLVCTLVGTAYRCQAPPP